jgi:hypothetical protein
MQVIVLTEVLIENVNLIIRNRIQSFKFEWLSEEL